MAAAERGGPLATVAASWVVVPPPPPSSLRAPPPLPLPEDLPPCPQLPAETEEGSHVEHKLHLTALSPLRAAHLVTQLRWRLREGQGRARYILGALDGGSPRGLGHAGMTESLAALWRLCGEARAGVVSVTFLRGAATGTLVAFVDVASEEEVHVPASPRGKEVRVAVLGASGAGKSTLIGVLTQPGQLDDGAGGARLAVVRHRHEIEAGGTTSSLSRHVLQLETGGGSSAGLGGSSAADTPRRERRSVAASLGDHDVVLSRGGSTGDADSAVTLVDLAGDARFRRTTVSGLLASLVDCALLVMPAAQALAPGTEDGAEAVLLADLVRQLSIPALRVLTKADLLPPAQAAAADANASAAFGECAAGRPVAVSCVSSVTGQGLLELSTALAAVQPTLRTFAPGEPLFAVQEVFQKGNIVVLAGTCFRGSFHEGEVVFIGLSGGGRTAVRATVQTIHHGGDPVRSLAGGDSGSLGFALSDLVDVPSAIKARHVTAGAAGPAPTAALVIRCGAEAGRLRLGVQGTVFHLSAKEDARVTSVTDVGDGAFDVVFACAGRSLLALQGAHAVFLSDASVIGGRVLE